MRYVGTSFDNSKDTTADYLHTLVIRLHMRYHNLLLLRPSIGYYYTIYYQLSDPQMYASFSQISPSIIKALTYSSPLSLLPRFFTAWHVFLYTILSAIFLLKIDLLCKSHSSIFILNLTWVSLELRQLVNAIFNNMATNSVFCLSAKNCISSKETCLKINHAKRWTVSFHLIPLPPVQVREIQNKTSVADHRQKPNLLCNVSNFHINGIDTVIRLFIHLTNKILCTGKVMRPA